MEKFSIPTIYCPFPSAINVHAAALEAHGIAWVQHFRLVQQAQALRRFEASKFAYLAARTNPLTDYHELTLIADWNSWLFLLDDQFDEGGAGRDPAQMQQTFAQLYAILTGAPPQINDGPFSLSLRDIWQRMEPLTTAACRERFKAAVADYFDACVWEAANRSKHVVPTRDNYIRLRRVTGAVLTDVELIDMTEHIDLPIAVRLSEPIQQLTDMANDVVCWTNDILSLRKEVARSDVHNLVLVIQHERQCPLQPAVDEAGEMIRARTEGYIAVERDLPTFGPAIDADLAKYRAVLRAWMRGNLDWERDSGRYNQVEESAHVSYLEPLLDSTHAVVSTRSELLHEGHELGDHGHK